jgi:transglutaminase-like putative cysteine protease
MVSDESGPQRAPTRDRARLVLVVCCLLAIVLAGVLVPALTNGVVDSPAESLLPGEALESNTSGEAANLGAVASGNLTTSGASGFGALNPGSSTDVGGATGADDRSAFQSQNDVVHFTVTSPQPAYWRTSAYDDYTGTGWEQDGGTQPLDGPLKTEGIEGKRLQYEVRLNRTAQALPTVWRPTTILDRGNLRVTDQRALRTASPMGPGERFVGVSHRPPQDPSVLRTSGTDYPPAIQQRYGSLPDATPRRVELFTNDLTRGDTTPYEKARTIENWLESTKEYSLNASRTSQQMADTFIFEMERGYCEYFATAMTVMLRSQGIPARYVVGYSTGQQTADSTYTVRALNAHAWVEVYFEGVGWVKFDPTPGRERLQQERAAMQQRNPDTDYAPQEQGSPGETFSPVTENTSDPADDDPDEGTDDDPTDPTDTDGTPSGQTDTGYDISLNRDAVPGAEVEVTVTSNGQAAVGVTVLFNGEPVGETDTSGSVVATVPYTEELNVSVADDGIPSLSAPAGRLAGDGRFYSVPPPSGRLGAAQADVTVPVETNATVTVSGDELPGSTVTVTATVGDVAVTDAAVLIDGTRRAMTDSDGRARVALPAEGGTVTITVERGAVSGSATLDLPQLNVSVAPSAPIPLPLTTATVTASAGGNPITGATVSLDGSAVATTGVDGTATVTLPVSSAATISVTALGTTFRRTVSGLLVNLGLVVGALVTLVVVPAGLAYRGGYTLRELLAALARLPGRVVGYATWALVTLATRGDDLLAALATRVRLTVAYLADLLRGKVTPGALRDALLAWLARKRAALGGHVGEEETAGAAAQVDADRRSIRAAWAQLLARVSLPRHRTKTPGEIARHAVHRDGLPAKPVRVLRDAFREVEYGARSASERLDRVERAVTALERDRDRDEEAEE